jgi:hypothetical protein
VTGYLSFFGSISFDSAASCACTLRSSCKNLRVFNNDLLLLNLKHTHHLMLPHKQHSITMSAITCMFPDVMKSKDSRTQSNSASAPSTIRRNAGVREEPGLSISSNTEGMADSGLMFSVCSSPDIVVDMVDDFGASRELSTLYLKFTDSGA